MWIKQMDTFIVLCCLDSRLVLVTKADKKCSETFLLFLQMHTKHEFSIFQFTLTLISCNENDFNTAIELDVH